MNVLILENSRLFQKMLLDLLTELGSTAECVRTGEEGLQRLRDSKQPPFNLIIASQHIFDSSGNEFIEYCRQNARQIPIILLTSEPNEALLKNAQAAGVEDIFPKTNLAYLKSSIRYYIKGSQSYHFNDGRVLYVEDSPSVSHIVIGYLKKMNLDVNHFVSAEEAFAEFCRNEYDLVITDVVLRDTMDGLSLVRMIRAQNTYIANTPILAMTGDEDQRLKLDLLHAGVNDYVTKPPVEEELTVRVNNLITNKRLTDQVRKQQRSLYQIAMTDQLTTCHNRHSLSEYAPKYIRDARRYEFYLCVMIIDLDHFKRINDEFGHAAGDTVLREIGRLLMATCRQGDVVARIGGEEFLILLPHCALRDAAHKGENLRSMIELARPEGIKVTASIGIASLNDSHDDDFEALYKAADKAVYLSKKNGRNRVTIDLESAALAGLQQQGFQASRE